MSAMGAQQFILDRKAQVADLCRRAHAKRLDAFGSATRNDFDPNSSGLDFLVEFEELPPPEYARCYFALKDGLEALFHWPVDFAVRSVFAEPLSQAARAVGTRAHLWHLSPSSTCGMPFRRPSAPGSTRA